ncbi:MAG: hypothetical protein CMJ76_15585 [Planctomycetaceae bacterium]|nr:hypothetical protein [Planctomycetaceae bacterium]
MHKKLVALLCVGVMITIAGCGASNPLTTPITGTVTYDGEPLEGATVTLTPEAGSSGSRSASGTTDASGNFTLTTVFTDGQNSPGAVGGSYTVRVSKHEITESTDQDQSNFDENEGDPSAAYQSQVMMMTEDSENSGPESLINDIFSSYEKHDNWSNVISIAEPVDGGAASTLNITLEDNGVGEAKIQ